MKKSVINSIGAALIALTLAGCNFTPEQIKVVANQAGLFSAVGWIALDNPDAIVKSNVCAVIEIIQVNATDVTQGHTYTEVIYPIVTKYVETKVEARYRPMTKAGSLAILGGVDMLFAAHPEWKANQYKAVEYVCAFCRGATAGLNMNMSEPVMKAAMRTASMRAPLKVEQAKLMSEIK